MGGVIMFKIFNGIMYLLVLVFGMCVIFTITGFVGFFAWCIGGIAPAIVTGILGLATLTWFIIGTWEDYKFDEEMRNEKR